jgi:hypothetical protein
VTTATSEPRKLTIKGRDESAKSFGARSWSVCRLLAPRSEEAGRSWLVCNDVIMLVGHVVIVSWVAVLRLIFGSIVEFSGVVFTVVGVLGKQRVVLIKLGEASDAKIPNNVVVVGVPVVGVLVIVVPGRVVDLGVIVGSSVTSVMLSELVAATNVNPPAAVVVSVLVIVVGSDRVVDLGLIVGLPPLPHHLPEPSVLLRVILRARCHPQPWLGRVQQRRLSELPFQRCRQPMQLQSSLLRLQPATQPGGVGSVRMLREVKTKTGPQTLHKHASTTCCTPCTPPHSGVKVSTK